MKKCEDCVYTDIAYWEQDIKPGKATPVYWCERRKELCADINECNQQLYVNDLGGEEE